MKQKGFTPILILLLIAIALSGYLLYTKQSRTTPLSPRSTVTSQAPQPSSVLTSVTPSPTNSPSTVSVQLSEKITWSVPNKSIPPTEETAIKNAFSKLNFKTTFSDESYAEIVTAKVSAEWGAFFGGERFKTPRNYNPTGIYVFLGHKIQSNWKLITTDDSEFCSTLNQIPENVMSQTQKAYYIDCRK